MIDRLEMRHYRCFRSFGLDIGPGLNVIVGPNNAGKSTIVSALRAVGGMQSVLSRLNPVDTDKVGKRAVAGFRLSSQSIPLERENFRYEFHSELATHITAEFSNAVKIQMRWRPNDVVTQGFYWMEVSRGQPASLGVTRHHLNDTMLGVLPGLRPLEVTEPIRDPKYLERNLPDRLATKHFRNQLSRLNSNELSDFIAFVHRYLPEIDLIPPENNYSEETVDLFYKEGGHLREISWAGDGIQVFLQILFHLNRWRDVPVLILDEPEVYLHPDLQARVLEAVKERTGQTIIATHSSEIVAAAEPGQLIWIDKSLKEAVRLTDFSIPADFGSVFNLKLSKVLVSKRALFVEGKDLDLLSPLAERVSGTNLRTVPDLAVVPLKGSDNWHRLTSFSWIATVFLRGTVDGMAVFDRDLHTEAEIERVTHEIEAAGLQCHFWDRHELESYLLVPAAIARLSGCPPSKISTILREVAELMREDAIGMAASDLVDEGFLKGTHAGKLHKAAVEEVDKWWSSDEQRLRRLPGKEVLSALNARLVSDGFQTVGRVALASEIRLSEIPAELRHVLKWAAGT